jgi:16S rRNA pseudouridine516 synthase
MRLDKFLSDAGIGSRHTARKFVRKGRVTLDSEVCIDEALQIDPRKAVIAVDGKVIPYTPHFVLLLNKPKQYLCSTVDEKYPSVLNLLDPLYRKRACIVGRLDVDTTGLLFLTDDGKLGNHIIHPKFGLEKEYEAELDGELTDEILNAVLNEGADIDGEIIKPKSVVLVSEKTARVVVKEGRYHEIKRLFLAHGREVVNLKRVRIGDFTLPKDLEEGKFRVLSDEETARLRLEAHMKKDG